MVEKDLGFHPSTASRFIKAYEQFGNIATSQSLGTGKVFEMLALPESIDRKKFLEGAYWVPSAGEVKTVQEMTVKEVREVTKPLKEAQKKAKDNGKTQNNKETSNLSCNYDVGETIPETPILETVNTINVSAGKTVNNGKVNLSAVIMSFSNDVIEMVGKYSYIRNIKKNELLDPSTKRELNDSAQTLMDFASEILQPNSEPGWKTEHKEEHLQLSPHN